MDIKISQELHISHKMVSSFLMHLESQQSSENLSQLGYPQIAIKTQDKSIITAAETNTCVSFTLLQNIINVPIFTSTIQQWLYEHLI